MPKSFFRPVMLACAAVAALALGACATPFNANVARFQSQLPVPQGQSFAIAPIDPSDAGGIEFGQYAALVASELERLGYRAAPAGGASDLIVRMEYTVDKGREKLRASPGFYDPFFDPYYRYGYYSPYYRHGIYGRRSYIYGFHDPFLFGAGFGRDIDSFTVYTSGLDLTIERPGGERVFEGRAEAQSRDNDLTYLVPNLIEAMFTGFPGNSGEKVRITLAPKTEAKISKAK